MQRIFNLSILLLLLLRLKRAPVCRSGRPSSVTAGSSASAMSSNDTMLDPTAAAIVMREPTRSECLGHQEFVLTYKSFEPSGPGCFPGP